MFAYHDDHSDLEWIEGKDDPELTPKPLRIAKRASLRRSESINTSRTFSTFSTLQTLVPTRSSSVHSTHAKPDLSQSNAIPRTSFNARVSPNPLQNYPTNTAAGTRFGASRFSTTSETHRQSFDQIRHDLTENTERKGPAEVWASTAAKFKGTRAFTTGSLRWADCHSHVDDEGLSYAQPTPLSIQRRVATDAALDCDIGHALHKKSSFGKGFITRIVSNLSHRPRTSTTTATKSYPSKDMQANFTGRPEPMEPVERLSDSSGRESNNSDLESALAAFPTPPTSSGTSPRPSETLRGTPFTSRTYRSLRTPEDASIMGAELKMTAEFDELDFDKGDSMLIAIDMEGSTKSTASGQDLWSQHVGLDVVVIIDNSLYTSPSMLMASCETTRALASILNVVTDRLAILCTSPINDHRTLGSDYTKIWPLSSIKERKLKTILDAIVTTKEKPTGFSWTNVVRVAKETLLLSPLLDSDTELLQDTFGHIIVLTNNAIEIPAGILTHERLQFHVVCPASIPLDDFDAIECNGWKLSSRHGHEPQAVKLRKDLEPSSLINKLRGLILHARSGRAAGLLSDISLDINVGDKCSIQGIIGKSRYLTLHPGEIRSVLIRLKPCSGETGAGRAQADSTALPEMGPDSLGIWQELDKMLKVPVKVLTARLKYKHSLLPAGTTCSVTADCKVQRRSSRTAGEMYSNLHPTETPTECAIIVCNRLAYSLATHGSPTRALSAFVAEFGEEGLRSNNPDYTHLVYKELKYQARILERIEIDASPKKSFSPSQIDMDISPTTSLCHPANRGRQHEENHRPDSCVTDILEEEECSSNDSQRGLLANRTNGSTTSERQLEKEDKSMHALVDPKGKSGVQKSVIKGRSMSFKHEEQTKENRERMKVMRHRRSVSNPAASTKKSSSGALAVQQINSAGAPMGNGLGAA